MVPEKIERLAPTARSFTFSDGAHRGVFRLSLQKAINASSAAPLSSLGRGPSL